MLKEEQEWDHQTVRLLYILEVNLQQTSSCKHRILEWDSWTEVADLGTGRKFLTGSVNSPVAGVIAGGGYQPLHLSKKHNRGMDCKFK